MSSTHLFSDCRNILIIMVICVCANVFFTIPHVFYSNVEILPACEWDKKSQVYYMLSCFFFFKSLLETVMKNITSKLSNVREVEMKWLESVWSFSVCVRDVHETVHFTVERLTYMIIVA